MDPLIAVFGLGVGLLVGLTGMGGGSLMTPLLILAFGVKPVTAVGTDLAYGAITKTVGGWRHVRLRTVDFGISAWMACGSVPAAVAGVYVLDLLEHRLGGKAFDDTVLVAVAGALVVTGVATLAKALVFPSSIEHERDSVPPTRSNKVGAALVGAVVGFVLGVTSAGSGALIAVALILLFRMTPRRVVGTDVFHAAILLWAAALAHLVAGNIDYVLAGNILIGSVPGVWIGSHLSTRVPVASLRLTLGVVLLGSGLGLLSKAGANIPAPALAGVPLLVAILLLRAHLWPRLLQRREAVMDTRTVAADEDAGGLAPRRRAARRPTLKAPEGYPPMTEPPSFDLQAHSTRSDGTLEPADVVRAAAAAGVALLSLTDHDTVDGVASALAEGDQLGVAVVPGLEISAVDGSHQDMHILGYLVDHRDGVLRERLSEYRADRDLRADRMVRRLRELGYELDDSVLEQRRVVGRPIGRPHIAQAVVEHPANAKRLAGEGLDGMTDFLVAYLIEGKPAFVGRSKPTVQDAIETIHAAGGLAVWAHPFWDVEAEEEVLASIERYAGWGLDGVEAFYATHTEHQTKVIARRSEQLDLLTTGSADFHGPEHRMFNAFRAFDTYGCEPRLGRIGHSLTRAST